MPNATTPSKKALILTGNNEIVPSIRNSLKKFEFTDVDAIENGIEALKKMSVSSYDMVICHNKLKFISGWNLIKEMKTSEKIPNMPTILMGDAPSPATDEELKAFGLVKYLQMPITEANLSFLINSTTQLFKTSGTIENKFTKAKTALIERKSEQAIEMYTELQGLTKKGIRSSMGLAEAYTQTGQMGKAESVIQEALKTDSKNTAAALMQVKIFITRLNFPDAEEMCLKMLAPIVDSPFHHVKVLNTYAEAKFLEQSEYVCLDGIKKQFKIPDFWTSMVRIHFQKSRFTECLQTVEKAMVQIGPSAELLNIKGACLRKENHLDEALSAYGEALKLSPMDARVYYNMAVCSIAKKAIRDAKQQLEMCLKISPVFPNAKAKLEEVEKYLKATA